MNIRPVRETGTADIVNKLWTQSLLLAD